MFETGSEMSEYGNGGPPRRGGWSGEAEYAYGQGEYPGEAEYYGQGEEEYPGEAEYAYGQGEYPGEAEYYGQGEEEYPGSGEGEYAYGQGEYPGEAEYYGQGEEEYPGSGEGEEEQFLPALIPVVGQVLGGLLGSLGKREAELGGYGEAEGEAGEAEEQFLHKILLGALGRETADHHEAPLAPQQEAEFTERLLEASDEAELARIIGGIVNTVGRVVQGVRSAANSPQGRAVIDAVAPLAQAALGGEAASPVLEGEAGEMEEESGQYEAARRVVQLASAAARDVATAPPGAPPQLVGELSVIRAARTFARPFFRSALRMVSPFARRYYGRRYHRFRRGYSYGYPWGARRRSGWGYGSRYSPRYRYGYRGYYGYQPPVVGAPAPEPPPEMPPPQPGYRWVAVPIGAPPPPEPPPSLPPMPPPEPAGPPASPGPPPDGAAGAPAPGASNPQGEWGRRRRRRRRYGRYGRSGGYGRYGGQPPWEEDGDEEFGPGGP
jgi:hypothetical protein